MSRDRQHQHIHAACAARRVADELLMRAIFGASFCEDAAPPAAQPVSLTRDTARIDQAARVRSALRAAA